MLDAPRDDHEVAGVKPQFSVPQPDRELPLDDEEQLVLRLVMVPDELALLRITGVSVRPSARRKPILAGTIGFHELQPIPERIVHIETFVSQQRLILPRVHAVVSEPAAEPGQVGDAQGDVGFLSRTELDVNPEVEVDRAASIPDPTAAGEMGGLCDFNETEQLAEEPAHSLL